MRSASGCATSSSSSPPRPSSAARARRRSTRPSRPRTTSSPRATRSASRRSSPRSPRAGAGDELYSLPARWSSSTCWRDARDPGRRRDARARAGDALTYPLSKPHTWRNASDTETLRVLWVSVRTRTSRRSGQGAQRDLARELVRGGVPRHHGGDEDTALDRRRCRCRAGRRSASPPCASRPAPAEEAVELAAVAHLREQPEQIAGLGGRDPERAAAAPARRLRDTPHGRAVPGRRRSCTCRRRTPAGSRSGSGSAPSRPPGDETSRSRRTSASRSARAPASSRCTRAEPADVEPASQTSSAFAAVVVGDDEHLPEQARDLRARLGLPSSVRRTVTAIASLSVDAAGKLRRAFQAAPRPVRRSWT